MRLKVKQWKGDDCWLLLFPCTQVAHVTLKYLHAQRYQQKQSVGTSVHAHDGHPGTPDSLCCITWSTEAKNLHQGFFLYSSYSSYSNCCKCDLISFCRCCSYIFITMLVQDTTYYCTYSNMLATPTQGR